MFTKSKQFLPLIRHPPCYSYIHYMLDSILEIPRVDCIYQMFDYIDQICSEVCVDLCSVLCVVFCRSWSVVFLLTIVLSVRRFTASDYPFGIFRKMPWNHYKQQNLQALHMQVKNKIQQYKLCRKRRESVMIKTLLMLSHLNRDLLWLIIRTIDAKIGIDLMDQFIARLIHPLLLSQNKRKRQHTDWHDYREESIYNITLKSNWDNFRIICCYFGLYVWVVCACYVWSSD